MRRICFGQVGVQICNDTPILLKTDLSKKMLKAFRRAWVYPFL